MSNRRPSSSTHPFNLDALKEELHLTLHPWQEDKKYEEDPQLKSLEKQVDRLSNEVLVIKTLLFLLLETNSPDQQNDIHNAIKELIETLRQSTDTEMYDMITGLENQRLSLDSKIFQNDTIRSLIVYKSFLSRLERSR